MVSSIALRRIPIAFWPGVIEQSALAVIKTYPQNYPHWDIAFAHVFDYTDSLEEMLISAPRTYMSSG